jgi:hypothetical protein
MAASGQPASTRLIGATVLAPIYGPLPISFALIAVSDAAFSYSQIMPDLGRVFGLSLLVSAFGLPATIVAGLPWHSALQARGNASIHAYWAPALIVGGALGAALMTIISVEALPLLFATAAGALSGASIALTFWLIRRPDRDARPTQAITTP